MRMTLGRKVAVGFGTIVVVMGISFVVNRKATERVNQAQAQAVMLEDSAKLMIEKVVDHYKWLDGLNNTFARNRDKVEVQLDPTKCGLGKWLAGEEAAALSEQIPQIAELLGTIQSPHNQLHNSAKHIDTLCQSGSEEAREQARHIFLEETPTHLAGVQENLNTIRSELEAEADTQIHALSSSLEQMSSTALVVFIATVLMACTAGLLITRSVVRPIHLIVNRIKDIAEGEGDLTQRVDQDSRDELGELGQWFNTFVEKVHGIIADVAIGAREVAGASTQIAASSEEMASGMNEQAKQITQISSAVEEMTASVVEVSRKAADASTNATSAGELAEQGGQVVAETIDGMNSISEAVMSSATSVSELGKRGEQIGEIIKVINDIADQTNLLALNAAIEAARAGEHGRGFAVVADEVRKLADRTTKATEEIAGSITAIQQETGEAVERMNVGKTQVESGVERARDAGESLDKIVQSTQGVAGLIQSIAAAAEEQSAASEEISRSLESISAVTNESTEGATQSAQAASQLSTKAEQLQEIVSQFKLRENTASLETLAS